MADAMEDIPSSEAQIASPDDKAITDIYADYELLRLAVSQFDPRLTLRALRSISVLRKKITPTILVKAMLASGPDASKQQIILPTGQVHDVVQQLLKETSTTVSQRASKEPPEIEAFVGILIQVYLYDTKQYALGAKFSDDLVDYIHNLDRRTLDPLAAKAYFYFSLFYEELAPKPPSPQAKVISIRPRLMAAYRTATLRKDLETQAAVIVLLLRNYLFTAHISQADAFLRYIEFPPSASNNQFARYMYYLGRIRAIQLSYTDAHQHLSSATRKAPSSPAAVGFYQASMKFLIVVELLMGDIPDRSYFSQPKLEDCLEPYFELVKAVRTGDLHEFQKVVQKYDTHFHKDGTHTLVLRLRQNVIRTGIRRLSLSYSRISLGDICRRLGLESEHSTEYIVAKAIGDGVIEASINRELGYMETTKPEDVYSTREPAESFDERIRACLVLHDENVRAMRFPMNQHKLELKNAQEARERERELATEIQDGDMDDDDGPDPDFDGL